MRDTTDEIAQLYRKMLLERGNEERLMMGVIAFDAARAMMLASLPGGLTPSQIRCALLLRTYGNDLPPETL